MKYCINCKYSKDIGTNYTIEGFSTIYGCEVKDVFDLVNGKRLYAPCQLMRTANGFKDFPFCGPEGLLFEAKE